MLDSTKLTSTGSGCQLAIHAPLGCRVLPVVFPALVNAIGRVTPDITEALEELEDEVEESVKEGKSGAKEPDAVGCRVGRCGSIEQLSKVRSWRCKSGSFLCKPVVAD
jgi:hypothetical protein